MPLPGTNVFLLPQGPARLNMFISYEVLGLVERFSGLEVKMLVPFGTWECFRKIEKKLFESLKLCPSFLTIQTS